MVRLLRLAAFLFVANVVVAKLVVEELVAKLFLVFFGGLLPEESESQMRESSAPRHTHSSSTIYPSPPALASASELAPAFAARASPSVRPSSPLRFEKANFVAPVFVLNPTPGVLKNNF